ncbi:MAG: hypothetical protein AAGJ35_16020, partial [Myxococcota bacterium]
QFIRMRSDKQPHPDDVRMAQITQQVEVSQADTDAKNLKLPNTELLKREVFAKELKGETMVRKFVILKTNKEDESDEYPAYVVHYTDFSPNRKEPLSRDVLVSSSKEQIEELYNLCKEKNIKKGWRQVLGNATSTDKLEVPASKELGLSPDKEANTKKKATKKKATKKTVAKKTTTKKKATKKKAATKTPRTPK